MRNVSLHDMLVELSQECRCVQITNMGDNMPNRFEITVWYLTNLHDHSHFSGETLEHAAAKAYKSVIIDKN